MQNQENESPSVVVQLELNKIKFKEELNEIYIYKDEIKQEYSCFYNDEIKTPLNLFKTFIKHYRIDNKISQKKFLSVVKDIKIAFDKEQNILQISYFM